MKSVSVKAKERIFSCLSNQIGGVSIAEVWRLTGKRFSKFTVRKYLNELYLEKAIVRRKVGLVLLYSLKK